MTGKLTGRHFDFFDLDLHSPLDTIGRRPDILLASFILNSLLGIHVRFRSIIDVEYSRTQAGCKLAERCR
ncbi:MAG: hypothetical protein FWC58_04515 [Desulfobulbus sp.]|nr:hypothetical protein [Desulfobulbus sp.]